jgi:hypothetical protein
MSSQGSFHVAEYINTGGKKGSQGGNEAGGRDISEYMEAR